MFCVISRLFVIVGQLSIHRNLVASFDGDNDVKWYYKTLTCTKMGSVAAGLKLNVQPPSTKCIRNISKSIIT